MENRIDWRVNFCPEIQEDIQSIQELTKMHIDQEIPYTLDKDLVRFYVDQILIAWDYESDVIGCFEHVIETPFSIKDKIFLRAIKQFPFLDYIDDLRVSGILVNCCQSAGIGKGSHRAMYKYQKEKWGEQGIWTWISVKSPLIPVLKDLGWKTMGNTLFKNIWKDPTIDQGWSVFQLLIYQDHWDTLEHVLLREELRDEGLLDLVKEQNEDLTSRQ